MPQDDVCLGSGSDCSSDSNSTQATVHTHFASCCCCCCFFLVHSACSSLGCKKCIWAKTTRQTCRLGWSRDVEWGSRRSLAWLAVELGVPCTLHPGPCSSPVIKRAVALEPPPGSVPVRFSLSAFGDCILEQAGRTLRVSQAVANYALRHNCLGPGRGVQFPPEQQQQQQWLHLSQARQTVGEGERARQTAADVHRLGLALQSP